MPELPEVETVRTGLEAAITGKTIARVRLMRADLRFPFPAAFAQRLEGRRILGIARRAKYLLFQLEGGAVWLAHLGMSGSFSVRPVPPARPGAHDHVPARPGAHDHVIVTFADGTALVFTDPRRFGCMDVMEAGEAATHPLLAHLGPEPLEKAFNAKYLQEKLAARRTSVKIALMDQAVVVGVGNIYASEALFAVGLDPRTPALEASVHAPALVEAIRQVLAAAIASGGSSLRDFFDVAGKPGYFQHAFAVYGRAGKPCISCASEIIQLRQGGRSTYFCPCCQRIPQPPGLLAQKPSKTAARRPIKKTILGA